MMIVVIFLSGPRNKVTCKIYYIYKHEKKIKQRSVSLVVVEDVYDGLRVVIYGSYFFFV